MNRRDFFVTAATVSFAAGNIDAYGGLSLAWSPERLIQFAERINEEICSKNGLAFFSGRAPGQPGVYVSHIYRDGKCITNWAFDFNERYWKAGAEETVRAVFTERFLAYMDDADLLEQIRRSMA